MSQTYLKIRWQLDVTRHGVVMNKSVLPRQARVRNPISGRAAIIDASAETAGTQGRFRLENAAEIRLAPAAEGRCIENH